MQRRAMRRRAGAVCAALVVLGGATWAPAPSHAAKVGGITDCFAELERGNGSEIVCEFPVQPSPKEQRELETQTYGYVKGAACLVSIRIQRALVTAAIETPDYVFVAPPQPVACNVIMPGKTGDAVVPITATFAPKVTIRSSVATEATPGLGEVKGVSRVLSLPVVAYVNRAHFLRDGMLKVVNTWLEYMRTRPRRAAAR